MPETWMRVKVPGAATPARTSVPRQVLRDSSGGDDESYWYLAWRLELASIDRNLVDQQKARRQLFEHQAGLCGECGEALGKAAGHDIHKRLRMFARHQGYVAGNVVLLHRACHERVHQREPHPTARGIGSQR